MSEDAIKLAQLIADVPGAKLLGDEAVEIAQIEYDSRLIKAGSLFFAVKGFKRDGYDFVKDAQERGAVAVMGERESCSEIANHIQVPDLRQAMATTAAAFYGYPGMKIKACGVTGTNGKTTTCFMIWNMMLARNKTAGLICSLVYDTGKDKFVAERTTPESLDIQRLLFLMKRNRCVNVVMEVSSHALVLNRVDHVDFRVAVYTNLTRDHLDFHQTMEAYTEAKYRLVRRLRGELSYAVINLDVDEWRPLFGELQCSHMTYALRDRKADIRCGDYELKPDQTIFDLVTPMGARTVTLQLPGRFNLQNALAAAGGGLASGIDLDNVVAGLEATVPVPGRLNTVNCGQPFAVYVDYAHTPDAIKRLCETVREINSGRLYLMFGCGGDRDRGKRPLMARAAVENATHVVVTSDNPRSEDPEAIIKDITAGLTETNYEVIVDRRAAIETILRLAGPNEAVLLAGKGAETYQEVRGERLPFSDTDEAVAALARMGFVKSGAVEKR
ncbi:MAG: UDP-N-acetylmuramoyl-L-alanyl-D-glutamate--2,6-diaminopimelate ligase [Candidatus Zixiibacteriota bacterium]